MSVLTSRSSGCDVVLQENILVCRKNTLECSRVMGQQVGTLLSNGLGKKEVVCAVL